MHYIVLLHLRRKKELMDIFVHFFKNYIVLLLNVNIMLQIILYLYYNYQISKKYEKIT